MVLEFCFMHTMFDGNLLLCNSFLSDKFTQTLRYKSIDMCETRCSMTDINSDELVMPGCLVRRPPTHSHNLSVPQVGVPESRDPVRELNVGELTHVEAIQEWVTSIWYNKICSDYPKG
jgi:hypothetical protein